MEVFSFALQKRAVKIMLCHNHPSGELTPSEMDKDITDRLIQVGIIVNCRVIDHLIITPTSYFSFEDIGLLDELKLSEKYVPPYILEQRIASEAAEIAKRRRDIEIAKMMKEEGEDFEKIALFTGLSIFEIENIEELEDLD